MLSASFLYVISPLLKIKIMKNIFIKKNIQMYNKYPNEVSSFYFNLNKKNIISHTAPHSEAWGCGNNFSAQFSKAKATLSLPACASVLRI